MNKDELGRESDPQRFHWCGRWPNCISRIPALGATVLTAKEYDELKARAERAEVLASTLREAKNWLRPNAAFHQVIDAALAEAPRRVEYNRGNVDCKHYSGKCALTPPCLPGSCDSLRASTESLPARRETCPAKSECEAGMIRCLCAEMCNESKGE